MKYQGAAILCLLIFTAAQSQTPGFRELSYSMRPSKSTFIPLEPIPMRFVIENRTDAGILIHGGFGFICSHVKLAVERPDRSIVNVEQLSPFLARCI
ncbi:MAG: hypothetical protein ACRENF_01675, partial [Thermodesulfobacteriota bacterium]